MRQSPPCHAPGVVHFLQRCGLRVSGVYCDSVQVIKGGEGICVMHEDLISGVYRSGGDASCSLLAINVSIVRAIYSMVG